MCKKYIYISGYKFIHISDVPTLEQQLQRITTSVGLKGTILLSHEGINIMLAGPAQGMADFKSFLDTDPRFKDIYFKESQCDIIPFKHLYIKQKKEIISLGHANIDPTEKTGQYLAPETLKQWLDDDRDIVLLDTRNNYEYAVGSFDNAINMEMQTFHQFPKGVAALDDSIKNKTVVMFCTGGIRCEKASAYMMAQGFDEIYQLEGGILAYFEKCGSQHYHGDCFVFDERIALDSTLQAKNHILCRYCQKHMGIKQTDDFSASNENIMCENCQSIRQAS